MRAVAGIVVRVEQARMQAARGQARQLGQPAREALPGRPADSTPCRRRTPRSAWGRRRFRPPQGRFRPSRRRVPDCGQLPPRRSCRQPRRRFRPPRRSCPRPRRRFRPAAPLVPRGRAAASARRAARAGSRAAASARRAANAPRPRCRLRPPLPATAPPRRRSSRRAASRRAAPTASPPLPPAEPSLARRRIRCLSLRRAGAAQAHDRQQQSRGRRFSRHPAHRNRYGSDRHPDVLAAGSS